MWLPEEESEKELTPETQNSQASQVDDIYVPGLGVRGVLYDDEKPAPSPIWPRVRAAYSRGANAIGRSASGTVGSFNRAGARVAGGLSKLSFQIRAAAAQRTSTSKQLAKNLSSSFQRAQQRVVEDAGRTAGRLKNDAKQAFAVRKATVSRQLSGKLRDSFQRTQQRLGEGVRYSAVRLKGVAQRCMVATPRLKAGGAQALQASRTRIVQVAQSAMAQARKTRGSRAKLPHFPAAVSRSANRARSISESFSKTALAELRKLPKVAARFQSRFTYRPDIVTLRRATPALVILGAIMLFTIQQILVVVRR